MPAIAFQVSSKKFVQLTIVTVDDQNMPITIPVGITFNGWVVRNGIRTRIALASILEGNIQFFLRAWYIDIGNAYRKT